MVVALSVIRRSNFIVIVSIVLFGFLLFSVGCNNTPVLEEKYRLALQGPPVVPDDAVSTELAPTTTTNSDSANISSTNNDPTDESLPIKLSADGRPPEGYTTEGKKLSIVHVRPIETLQQDGIHDLENDAVTTLQDPRVAMGNFPLDRRKQVNWVATLDAGLIQPRADLKGEQDMLVMDMDIIMKNTQFMPYVKFPHIAHTKWLDCSNCHPKIFIPEEHANPISMNKVLRGEYCGVCHDKVAFALFICERCHSVPHKGSGKKWW